MAIPDAVFLSRSRSWGLNKAPPLLKAGREQDVMDRDYADSLLPRQIAEPNPLGAGGDDQPVTIRSPRDRLRTVSRSTSGCPEHSDCEHSQ